MTSHTLSISGMSCNHCVRSVRLALESVEGAVVTTVSIGTATVDVPDGASRVGDLTAAVENAGFTVTAVQG